MSSQLLSVQINSEQADYFDESVIDPLENPLSTRWTAVPPEAHQASVIRRPITVICSPLQLIAAGPDSQVPAPVQRYLLNINLKKGRNLVIRDKRSGRSKNSRWSVSPGLSLPESLRPWGDDYWLFISLHQTVLITVGIVLKQSRSRDTISGFMYTLKECGSFVFCFFFCAGFSGWASWWNAARTCTVVRRHLVDLAVFYEPIREGSIGAGTCVVVCKGKMGYVQLMLLFTRENDVSCRAVYVQRREKKKKKHERSMRSDQYDKRQTGIERWAL